MQDRWKLLKRIGRYWCILTHEDRDADASGFLEILIVPSASDRHADQAIAASRGRFPHAMIRVLGPALDWWQTFRQLRRWRGEQLSAVVLLSLQPVLVVAVCRWFPCYKLLYNRWGEWYLIRRKTMREWLVGRRGADDRRYDWPPESPRTRWLQGMAQVTLAVPIGVVLMARAIRLSCWIVWRIAWLYGHRLAYRLGGGR